ncbi:MAG: hypothetical protein SW019_22030 [Actinomycetota bacterium]|nr:hypothetical protein [Actinomycetota bacterium]
MGLSLAAVVALVVGLLVWQARSDGASGGSGQAADDVDRTVGVLREKDPVCEDWWRYGDQLAADTEQWAQVDKSEAASEWTAEQREVFFAAGEAISAAANRFQEILPQARSPILQILISQSIVYWRQYLERLPNYEPVDGRYAEAGINFAGAVTFLCTAVPLVPDQGGDERASRVANPGELVDFMPTEDVVCSEFLAMVDEQNAVLGGWASTDPTVSASQWSDRERLASSAARKVLAQDAGRARDFSDRTENDIFSDLLFTYAAYLSVFSDALPTYVPDDDHLWKAAIYLGGGLVAACEVST